MSLSPAPILRLNPCGSECIVLSPVALPGSQPRKRQKSALREEYIKWGRRSAASTEDRRSPCEAEVVCGMPQTSIHPRNRREPLSAQEPVSRRLAAAASRPTPTVSGERRPFDSAACEPRRLRTRQWRKRKPTACAGKAMQASGKGRSRAERPTIAGCIFRCKATAYREQAAAIPRQFMIGGLIGRKLK